MTSKTDLLYFPLWGEAPEPDVIANLRQQVDDYLGWLAQEASSIAGLKGLVLAGGYGRGEGGVWWPGEEGNPKLYNDMEFYIFAPMVEESVLENWIHRGEELLGLEMEFKVMKPENFSAAKPSMFYYDLLQKNVFLAGDLAWWGNLPPTLSDTQLIPSLEASRLLVNRGMSLLRCLRWSRGERDLEPDFCDRIVAKLKMALGDAVLCLNKQYHWSCQERHRRLADVEQIPPDWTFIKEHHHEGVTFKFHPQQSNRSASEWQGELQSLCAVWSRTFLWIEGKRLGRPFPEVTDYIGYKGRIFPDEPAWKNLLREVRDLKSGSSLPLSWGDHPRGRVWKGLVALMAGKPELAQGILGVRSIGQELEEICRKNWQRYP